MMEYRRKKGRLALVAELFLLLGFLLLLYQIHVLLNLVQSILELLF